MDENELNAGMLSPDAAAPAQSVEEAENKVANVDGIMSLDPNGGAENPQVQANQPVQQSNPLQVQMDGAFAQMAQNPSGIPDPLGQMRRSIGAALEGARRSLRTNGLNATETMMLSMADNAKSRAEKAQSATPQNQQTQIPQNQNSYQSQNLQQQMPQNLAPQNGEESKPVPIGGEFAQSVGVTMRKSRGREIPTYTYNNVNIDLPDGIDLNDDEAVKGYVDAANANIDMMNMIYSDEED